MRVRTAGAILVLLLRGASSLPGAQEACPTPRPIAREPAAVVDWLADPGLEPTVRRLAAEPAAIAPLPGLGPASRVLEPGTRVLLVRDLGCVAVVGEGGRTPDWVAGFANSRERYAAVRFDPARDDLGSVRQVLRHELAHLALAATAGDRVPRWLHEGYAQYASGGWDWRAGWRLRFALFSGGADRLRELSLRFPSDPDGARLAYLLSYTAVHELASLAGEAGLAAFFEALAGGGTVDQAMRGVFGITEDQFATRWARTVSRRYGVLYLLSRAGVFWLLVTVALLWLGGIRRRRNRRRLERLRAQEREEEARAFVDGFDGVV